MSVGSNVLGKNDPLIKGAEALWDEGICVVVAGGNSGPDVESIKSPGASPKLITVGAIDAKGNNLKVADFSSRGPILNNYKPDLVAPGVDIIAGCSYTLNKKHYSVMSGTSVSTPIIAGIVCNILSNNNTFSPFKVKNFLIKNCTPITYNRNAEGFGYFNGDVLKNNLG
jgi:serine protease AprX